MKSAPIALEEYFVTDMSLSANRSFTTDKPIEAKAGDFGVEVNVQRAPVAANERRWQVTLELKHQSAPETNFPYAFRIVMAGFFHAELSVKSEAEERTIRIHGASVLYGMAREIVRAMTGRGPHRPVMLPTVSFFEPPPIPPASTPKPATAVIAP